MRKTYQLQTTDAQGQRRTQTIDSSLGPSPTVIATAPGERHVLLDVQQGSAPDNIRVQRVGKQLRVLFDGSTQADLVLDNFYSDSSTDGPATLAGATEQGSVHEYLPETGQAQDTLAALADNARPQGMALGSTPLATPSEAATVGLLAPVAVGGMGLGTLGAGVLGAVAIAGGGGGGNGGAPINPNSKLQPEIAQMSEDSQTDADWITSDTTPTFNGRFGAEQTWTHNGDRFRFQIFNANGEKVMEADESTITSDKASWTATASSLTDGAYVARAIITTATGHVLSQDQQAFVIDHTAASCRAGEDVRMTLNLAQGGSVVTSFSLSSNEAVSYTIRDGSGNLLTQGHYNGSATEGTPPVINGSFAAGNFKITYTDMAGNTSTYTNDTTLVFNNVPVTTITRPGEFQLGTNPSAPLGGIGTYRLAEGQTLDLSHIMVDAQQHPVLHNTLDMSHISAQTLSLSLDDVLNVGVVNSFLSDDRVQLMVSGDGQDRLHFEDLTAWKARTDVSVNGLHYWSYVSTHEQAEVLVQQAIAVS